jgi:hypothetical protein
VIHGDASIGNVLRDRQGNPVVIDLDGFAIGPREWNVVLTAIHYDSFGWHTREEHETFARVHGFDIMTWPGYRVLREIREFLMVTWVIHPEGKRERAHCRRGSQAHSGTAKRAKPQGLAALLTWLSHVKAPAWKRRRPPQVWRDRPSGLTSIPGELDEPVSSRRRCR